MLSKIFLGLFFGSMVLASEVSVVTFSGTPDSDGYQPQVTVQGAATPLQISGVGKRTYLGIFSLYTIGSYVEDLSKMDVNHPLDSIKASKARLLRLSMQRNMTSDEVQTAFVKALTTTGNDVNIDDAGVKDVLAQVDFDVVPGDSVLLIGLPRQGNQESVTLEYFNNGNLKKTHTSTADFLSVEFWKIWFGVPVDSNMSAVQKGLFNKINR